MLRRLLALVLALGVAPGVAETQTAAALRLEEFILVNLASSQDGAGVAFADDWCFTASRDLAYNWWHFHDITTDGLATARVRNALGIPFAHQAYGGQAFAVMLVGFEATGESDEPAVRDVPGPRDPSAAARLTCHLGAFILAEAPLPVSSIPAASDLPKVTLVDPAPDYRWLYVGGRPLRVRTVLSIPVKFQAQGKDTPGHIIVGIGRGE